MARPAASAVARVLLLEYGPSFAEEAGVRVQDAPASLFQLLVLALLSSARIRRSIAAKAARGLFAAGLKTPRRMADATWRRRVQLLDEAGYAHYDERTSTQLYRASTRLLTEHGGDLRRLREETKGDPAALRAALNRFEGIGDVGVDIFFREVQLVWRELYPFVDERARCAATRLGLPRRRGALEALVGQAELPVLLDAALRATSRRAEGAIRAAAGRG